MRIGGAIKCGLFVWLLSVVLPAAALAQSAIAGQVKDTSGAVMPGVTVEAASPALIEKVRTVVTDAQGLYTIVDLRPGSYTVTFTLGGFSTVVRSGVDLPSNFTATVNAEMRIGALEETLTVSGAAPTVDTRAASTTQVLSRALVDAVPTARDFRGLGATVPGVKPNIQNVGGTRALVPQILTVHGSDNRDTATIVDGLIMNSMMGDDNIHLYHNDALVQEINYQTSAIPAEYSKGGVIINIAPRDGGNAFHGAWYSNYSNTNWQANNLTPELIAKRLTSQNRNGGLYDINPWVGGPILKDRLWFIASYRDVYVKEIVANTFFDNGDPGFSKSNTRNASTRLTWQATQKDKISFHYDRQFKRLPSILNSGQDAETGGVQRFPRDYLASLVKWTHTQGGKWLFDTGWGTNHETYLSTYLDGVERPRGTAEWYARASRFDQVLNTRSVAGTQITGDYPRNNVLTHSTSYVTGSHNIKMGAQWRYGIYEHTDDAHGDLIQNYLNGVPDSVTVLNTPTNVEEYWNADIGLFVQDSWVFKRMTVNGGVRFEYFDAQINAQTAPAGRFVPERTFAAVDNMPQWKNWSPRLGLVYDLFGNGKTALKFGANRYNQGQALGFARRYNPMAVQTDARTWRDTDLIPGTTSPSGLVLPTNGDNIAQENEIGPSQNNLFGRALTRRPDPDIRRAYNVEYSAIVQHQLLDRVGVTAGWFRRRFYNLTKTVNLAADPVRDYTAFQVPDPRNNGQTITVFNLNRNKQGQIDQLETNSDINKNVYTGFEISFASRFERFNIYGGWTANRTVLTTCDTDNPNSFRFCDQNGNLYQELGASSKIPFRHDFKLNGYYRLPYGFQINLAWQSYAGAATAINYPVPPAAFNVVGGRTAPVTVPLAAPGTVFLDRWNQMDAGVKKSFNVGGEREISLQLDVFNALNASSILGEVQTFGPSLNQPTEILQGRFARIATIFRF